VDARAGDVRAAARAPSGAGLLDAGDVVLHAGPTPLRFSSLGEGLFDGQVKILRPGARR
jgi:hypothetical protein